MIAAEQLTREGGEVHAGKNVCFLFTDAVNKRYDQRVWAEQLIEQGVNADAKKYLFLLYASAASLLGFAGYTAESIYDAVRGYNHRSLFDYSAKK